MIAGFVRSRPPEQPQVHPDNDHVDPAAATSEPAGARTTTGRLAHQHT
jgi:hypothetical protein